MKVRESVNIQTDTYTHTNRHIYTHSHTHTLTHTESHTESQTNKHKKIVIHQDPLRTLDPDSCPLTDALPNLQQKSKSIVRCRR